MADDDDIMDFFDLSVPFERKVISGGYSNGMVIPTKLNTTRLQERVQLGTEYSASYAKEEESRLIKAFTDEAIEKAETSRLDDVDDIDSMAGEDKEHLRHIRSKELMGPLFARYNFTVDLSGLPIQGAKSQILDVIRRNPVVVLQGMTGCGKTTQVPQYLLEEAYQRKEYCNIVVTQPRRIAAMSIAKRVAEERCCELGSLVGFKVGLKEKISPDTRLCYVTTGVLLQRLISDQAMNNYTHVILDEVHEREVDMDFLLIIVRRLLATNSRNTKIILMSATIDGMAFSQYFKIPRPGSLVAPQLSVATKSQYDVSEFYLDQIDQLNLSFNINYQKPSIAKEMYTIAGKLSIVCDRLIDKFEPKTLSNIDYKPSIIIFLPGVNEIEAMANELHNLTSMQESMVEKTKFTILKLHSLLNPDEQALVFLRPPTGYRKVILSTNIAESSITIPDIKFVIDFCLTRVLFADTINNFTSLRTQWASKNNCIQRAGRAGRVMNGRVYRLVEKTFYETGMAQSSDPEMIRCPLGNVVLKAKQLGFGQPHETLGLALTPPNLSDITNTVLQLKEMGAMLRTANGVYSAQDGDLTYLGKLMSMLPLELHLAKLVVLGYVFSVLDEAIIIAAGMNVKNIFYQLRTVRSFSQKMRWADGSGSDGIAILNAFITWRSMKEQGTGGNTVEWCRRMHLDRKSLMEMAELVQEIQLRLQRANIREVTGPKRVIWNAREKTVVLKVVMAGAFYPHYFTTTVMGEREREQDERRVYSELAWRDPFSTVILCGFDNRTHIGPLYRQQIKNLLTDGDQSKHEAMKVDFDNSTNKIYIRFTDQQGVNRAAERSHQGYNAPGRIHQGVYEAVKQCSLQKFLELKVMRQADAIKIATLNNLGTWKDNQWHPRRVDIPNARLSVVPRSFCSSLRGIVTHVDNPGQFFIRPLSEECTDVYRNIDEKLNADGVPSMRFSIQHVFRSGQIVAAPNPHKNNRYGRAQLVNERKLRGSADWMVLFIDHGVTTELSTAVFRQMTGQVLGPLKLLPRRVFQASLAEVQPAAVFSPQGTWTREVTKHFCQLVHGRELQVEIFSVVNQVVSVVLRRSAGTEEPSINQELIAAKYAQVSEESYISKMNHHTRKRIQREITFDENYRKAIMEDDSDLQLFVEDDEIDVQLPSDLLHLRVTLRGPYSPLQVRCHAVISSGYSKTVAIDGDSVNTVLLDANPQDAHSKLLIAGCVNENSFRNLIARQTSMMPNIPGMPVLMPLIFAPTCLLKTNSEKTHVVGLMAGLGLHPVKNVPIYPEHDLSVQVDVTITDEDIADINALRYSMDSILQAGRAEDTRLLGEYSIESLMVKVKEYLIKILQRERSILSDDCLTHDYQWMSDPGEGSSSKSTVKNCIYTSAIFQLHDNLNLRQAGMTASLKEFQRRHCSELHMLADTGLSLPNGGIRCQLCDVMLETLHSLRLHLPARLHREREKLINYRRA